MSTIDSRREQMFPTLAPQEIDRIRRFGRIRRYAAGEALFTTGEIAPGMYVLIKGAVRVVRRDPLGHSAPIVEQGPGEFVAEVGQLSGQPAFVDVHAISEVEALLIPPENLRALMIEEPELGERIMHALILRRVALIEAGTGGPVLIGPESSPDVVRLQGFLARNAYPHQLLDPAKDDDAARLVQQYAPAPADLPLAVCPKGTVLKNPSEADLARALGMVPIDERDQTYDVAIVGAGPAGLSTAVYAASEGLSVIVLDACAFGGQAGASARIENYLGFPAGISGQALTGRAYVQAQKFGARMLIPASVSRLDPNETSATLHLEDSRRVKAATVVVATGARYRRLNVPNLADFEGRGVSYWASPIEARLCRNEEIVLVGGGNSAGQAAVFLRNFAAKIWMLMRGPSLEESMSRYLIDRIASIDNIQVLTRTEVVALYGSREGQLERLRWRNNVAGVETEKPIRHVFLFIGAEPATAWLNGSRAGRKELHSDGIGRCFRQPRLKQRAHPPAAAGNQRSRRFRRRRRAVGISQAGGRRDRRGGSGWGGASCRSCERQSQLRARGAKLKRAQRRQTTTRDNELALTAVTATNCICGNAACTRSAVSMTLAPGCLNTIRRAHGCSFDSSGRLTNEQVAAVTANGG